MGRNIKPGITFYRMDSGHILNKKIRLLCNEFDSDGYYIWSCIVDKAYGVWGYYFDMNDPEELDLFASEYCKKKLTLVKEVIAGCIRRGLFDKTVFDLSGVLTSQMMQEVFIYATAERRRQGSTFEMRKDLLKLDFGDQVPVNLEIFHGKKGILHVNNPQTRHKQDKTEDNTKREGLGAKPPPTKRKFFIPPDLKQVQEYFILTIGNPKNVNAWPRDKCHNEASVFIDHYIANGWVQKKGKPIVDWQAACRNFIRNDLKGTFSNKKFERAENVSQKTEKKYEKPKLDKIQSELNYMYDRFMEDEGNVTVISTDAFHYNKLKQAGLLNFNQERTAEIKSKAEKQLNGETTEQSLQAMMKRIGVIEFFKDLKQQAKETVFSVA